METYIPSFGRIEPPIEHRTLHDTKYAYKQIYLPIVTVTSLEKEFPFPSGLESFYNQGKIGACVGYSCSIASTIKNQPHIYNAYNLYKRAQVVDKDPNTSDDMDGTYLFAAGDTLRKEGHWPVVDGVTKPIDLQEGIESYYWIHTWEELLDAFNRDYVPVFGISWYESFSSPTKYNNESWIGRGTSWGQIVGGHAICGRAISTSRDAVRWRNSWGAGYPEVWVPRTTILKLLSTGGECMVMIDRPSVPTPPPPPVPTEITIPIELVYKSKTYVATAKAKE